MAPLCEFQRAADRTLRSRRDETLLVESKRVLVCLVESDPVGSRIALKRIVAELQRSGGAQPEQLEYALAEVAAGRRSPEKLAPSDAAFSPLCSIPEPSVRRKVLVVDDDEMMLRWIELVLTSGFADLEVMTTTSGYEACIQYGGFRPDLVILDLQIPDVDGEEALGSMLTARRTGSRFLVVSAERHRFERMLELGCDDCLPKPLDEPALLEKVRSLLPEATLRDGLSTDLFQGGTANATCESHDRR